MLKQYSLYYLLKGLYTATLNCVDISSGHCRKIHLIQRQSCPTWTDITEKFPGNFRWQK